MRSAITWARPNDRYVVPGAVPGPRRLQLWAFVDTVARPARHDGLCRRVHVFRVLRWRAAVHLRPTPTSSTTDAPLGVSVNSPQCRRRGTAASREIAPYVVQFSQIRCPAPATPHTCNQCTGGADLRPQAAVSGNGIDCGPVCSKTYAANTQVTPHRQGRAPAGGSLAGAARAAPTLATLAMSASRTASAAFTPSLHLGPLMSSGQDTESLLRFRQQRNGGRPGDGVAHQSRDRRLCRPLDPAPASPRAPRRSFLSPTLETRHPSGARPLPAAYAATVEPEVRRHGPAHPAGRAAALANLSTCGRRSHQRPGPR